MKFARFSIALLFLVAPLLAADAKAPPPKNSGDIGAGTILPRVVQGGGWATEIQVINTNDEGKAMPYTVEFFDQDGQPLTVSGSGSGVNGSFTVMAGVLPYRGVHIVTLPNVGGLRAGYGVIEVSDFRGVVVNSVLTQTVPGRPDFQMTIPSLGEFGDHMRMVFRNSRPYTTALAITSSSAQNWTFRAFDQNGIQQCEFKGSMKRDEHLAFALTSLLACTAGRDGLLEIEADFVGGTVVGIVAHDAGPFTVQLPYEICCVL
jgi:hypothetical protein